MRASVQRVLDQMHVPAIVYNAKQDIIAANLMGRALYAPLFDAGPTPDIARFVFLDPRAKDFYVDWALARRTVAAMMRLAAGRDRLNEELTALIGELSAFSPHFRSDWDGHDVHEHRHGVKSLRHPAVGVVEVSFEVEGGTAVTGRCVRGVESSVTRAARSPQRGSSTSASALAAPGVNSTDVNSTMKPPSTSA